MRRILASTLEWLSGQLARASDWVYGLYLEVLPKPDYSACEPTPIEIMPDTLIVSKQMYDELREVLDE